MLIYRNPYLKGVISILAIDLIQVEAIIHALFNTRNVFKVPDFKPMVEHGLNPALGVQKIKSDFTAEKFRNEKITLPLQIIDYIVVHLLE